LLRPDYFREYLQRVRWTYAFPAIEVFARPSFDGSGTRGKDPWLTMAVSEIPVFSASENNDDIRGATVYGLEDEKLGEIDDLIFDHSTMEIRYVVVDSGGWLPSRKFLLPADHCFCG